MTTDQVHELVTSFLQQRLQQEAPPEIGGDTNLLTTGLIDSLGFLDLIVRFEQVSGKDIDLLEVEAEDIMTVRGIAEYLSRE